MRYSTADREHRLDHRATLLAEKISHRIGMLRLVFNPPGGRQPFVRQHTTQESLAFWRKHRYSPIGQQVLARLSPAQIMELDSWLARNPDPNLERPLVQ